MLFGLYKRIEFQIKYFNKQWHIDVIGFDKRFDGYTLLSNVLLSKYFNSKEKAVFFVKEFVSSIYNISISEYEIDETVLNSLEIGVCFCSDTRWQISTVYVDGRSKEFDLGWVGGHFITKKAAWCYARKLARDLKRKCVIVKS